MLCYMVICKAPLTEGYSEVLSAWQAGENKSSNYGETQTISHVTSHSEVQEESHSIIHSAGPTSVNARFWDTKVRDQNIRRSQRSAERSGRDELADGGLDMSSHRYFGDKPFLDLATRSRTLYITQTKIGSQCSSLIM